jgi:hypothetical protein
LAVSSVRTKNRTSILTQVDGSTNKFNPLVGTGMFLTFSGIFTFLVDAYPAYAASALAANTFVRCMFAAAFPLFGEQSKY